MDTVKLLINKINYLPKILLSLLALLSLYALVECILPLVDNAPTITINQPAINASSSTPTTSALANLHLFGQYAANANLLPLTNLPLTLQGIVLSLNPSEPSLAIISVNSAPAHVYKIGQDVTNGVIITKILRDRVVLQDGQQLENLKLPIPKLANAGYTNQ